jgi:glucose/arabinose dehydrogenase
VYEYFHDGGTCAVTGGYVYRGDAIPRLRGWYVFADHCQGRLQAVRPDGDGSVRHRMLDLSVNAITSFGEDADGELYVLSREGGVYRLVPRRA